MPDEIDIRGVPELGRSLDRVEAEVIRLRADTVSHAVWEEQRRAVGQRIGSLESSIKELTAEVRRAREEESKRFRAAVQVVAASLVLPVVVGMILFLFNT